MGQVLFQAFVPQREFGLIPVKHLEFIPAFIAKHKYLPTEHITVHFLLDDGSETVDGLTKINWLTM